MTKINDNGIDRNMTEDELAALQLAANDDARLNAQRTTRAAAAASGRAKLAALGLNDDEINALLGT